MIRLRESWKEPLRFAIVGAAATGIHYAVYFVAKIVLPLGISFTLGYVVSLISNFFLSSIYTFRRKPTTRRGARFLLSHAINYLIQITLLHVFVSTGIDDTEGYEDIVNRITIKEIQEFTDSLLKQGNKITVIMTVPEEK